MKIPQLSWRISLIVEWVVLDGRTALGTLRWELNQMMRYVLATDIH